MESCFIQSLSNDDWFQAIEEFADITEDILWNFANGVQENYSSETHDGNNPLIIIGAAIIIPLLLALFMMNGKLKKMKTAIANDYAADYMKSGSCNITTSRDIFFYTNIIKTEKPKSNTSSTHTSSSGRTHGGSGGSF